MKEFELNGVKVELSKDDLEKMLKDYDEPEFDYPICCKNTKSKLIVLFDDVHDGIALRTSVISNIEIGEYDTDWIPHTDKDIWEQIPYDKERGLYHGQWVWCWDDFMTHAMTLRKYNAIKKCSYATDGKKKGSTWDNYSATPPKHMKEAIEELNQTHKQLT